MKEPTGMKDDVWSRNEIESPCVKVCVVHPESRLCTGCLRTIDEIGAWSKMSPESRRALVALARDCQAGFSAGQKTGAQGPGMSLVTLGKVSSVQFEHTGAELLGFPMRLLADLDVVQDLVGVIRFRQATGGHLDV